MILVAIGANLESPEWGSPRETGEAALAALEAEGVRIVRRSGWYDSAPVPPSAQPRFVNGVVAVETALDPAALLACLHAIEARFGRVRSVANAARILDLDLLDYDGQIADGSDGGPILPHPRMQDRAFVLMPLAEIAPGWTHPVTQISVEELLAALPPGQDCRPLA